MSQNIEDNIDGAEELLDEVKEREAQRRRDETKYGNQIESDED